MGIRHENPLWVSQDQTGAATQLTLTIHACLGPVLHCAKQGIWLHSALAHAHHARCLTCRSAIAEVAEAQRGHLLPLLPRHSIEPLFSAFCSYQASAWPQQEPFQALSDLAPDLDLQLYHQARHAFPGLNWQAWSEWVQVASVDVAFRERVAEGLAQSLADSTRKALNFD